MKTLNFIGGFLCLALTLCFAFTQTVSAQGCVAIQGMGCSNPGVGSPEHSLTSKGNLSISTNYRYFKSFRHFRGDVEEKHRVENNTEVINKSNFIDLGIGYGITNRLSVTVNIPFSFHDRSSLYEHYGNSLDANPDQKRFHTSSAGLGDIRITANYWFRDVMISPTNFALGLGVKMPTGNPHVTGEFHKLDEEGNDYTITQPVDQSIQLGDGGWGIILEGQAYHSIFDGKAALYFSGQYLFNPKNHNDELRRLGGNPDNHWSYFSAPDQFGARMGVNYFLPRGFSLGLGGLIEGVPAKDLIGKSEGYRRPGHAISVEPVIGYNSPRWNANLSVPVAVYRNRIKSVRDLETGGHGDAAFADYLVNFSFIYNIPLNSGPVQLD